MNSRIVNTTKPAARIVNTSARAKALQGAVVGRALGGQVTGYQLGKDTSPITLYQMREEFRNLHLGPQAVHK